MLRAFLIFFSVVLFSVLAVALWVFLQIPSEKELKGCIVTKMYEVNLCPGSKDYVPLRQISPYLQRAIVASEDGSFWTHNGFDWEALEKSARENWEKGVYKRGGSTITQQLAKNMFLTKNKTLARKGIEALITVKIEKTLSKKEILERYLNVVEFGKGIYGVKAAARFYFKKSPAELDLVESAFLAMVLPNPVKYSRSHSQKSLTPFAHRRIRKIISDMARNGRVSADEADAALAKATWMFGEPPPPAPEEDAAEELTFDESEGTTEAPKAVELPAYESEPAEADQDSSF